ncbi:MAG: hydrogenase maturation protease [Cyanobacteria bacterium SZAS LIN-3]|nr:hydrogenase maturation protease [Cyanobacteria bacterium SZAS LIN-3]
MADLRPTLTIIGCGNSNRCDDGVGVYVVQQLKTKLPNAADINVRIFDAGTGGMEVMFQARGTKALIIIDANRSESEPGAIFEVPGEVLENCHKPTFGLHDFRWDHALYAGKQIFKEDFPKDIQVFLIEAAKLEFGLELSDTVKASADVVVEKILNRVENSRVIAEA